MTLRKMLEYLDQKIPTSKIPIHPAILDCIIRLSGVVLKIEKAVSGDIYAYCNISRILEGKEPCKGGESLNCENCRFKEAVIEEMKKVREEIEKLRRLNEPPGIIDVQTGRRIG